MKMHLKYWRTKRAMSIRDLAEKSKVSSSTIIAAEKTGRLPRPNVIRRLAIALEVEIEELVLDGEPESEPGYVYPKGNRQPKIEGVA